MINIDGILPKNVELNYKNDNNKIIINGGGDNSKIKINFLGENAKLIIGKNVNFRGVITLSNNSVIEIGDNFKSTNGITLLCRDNCKIKIGKNCLFATNILIRTSDEHSIYDINSKLLINKNKNIEIMDDVWVCDNVLILKGSTICEGSVIGAKSVVCGYVPNNVIAAGNPCRIIKPNIFWKIDSPHNVN